MIKKKNPLLFLLFYLIEYNDLYKNRHKNNWGHKDYGFTQYNPILNGRIIEPVNSFSSLSILILINKYKDTIFDLLQFITILDIGISSFLYHASRTQYGLYLDYNAINMYLINLIVKDLYIMRIIKNEKIIKKYLPNIILINRLLLSSIVRKRFRLFNPIHSIQTTIFDCLMVFKITGEIVKLSDKVGTNILIYFLVILSSCYKSFFDFKKIELLKKNRKGEQFLVEPVSIRGTSNIIGIVSKFVAKIAYFLFVFKKRNNKEQINKQYIVFVLPTLFAALIFHEDYINCCRVNTPKSIKKRQTSLLQFHSIWHILCALAFYFYDNKYLKPNIENVSVSSKNSKPKFHRSEDIGLELFVAGAAAALPFFLPKTKNISSCNCKNIDTSELSSTLSNDFDPNTYIACDTEMVGIGASGKSAIARISLTDWYGRVLYDEFVKPLGRITNYRTWVSGIREMDMKKAIPFARASSEVKELIKGKILVGHAVHNDLKYLELKHPSSSVRDTSQYPPLMRRNTKTGNLQPRRLKDLAKKIGYEIQSGSHSSVEDAQATMKVYRYYKKEWDRWLKSDGKYV